MRWRNIAAAVLAVLVAWLSPSLVSACIPAPEYFNPTTFEHVQTAKSIVVATPVRQEGEGYGSRVFFKVDRVLKGIDPRETGATVAAAGEITSRRHIAGAPLDDEGFIGVCGVRTFSRQGSYILFLQGGDENHYYAAGSPPGEQSLWLDAIQSYMRIAAELPAMGQIEALKAMRDKANAEPPSARRDLLIADIGFHLQAYSPLKPTPFLIAGYETLKSAPKEYDRDRGADVLLSLVNGDHADAAPFFDGLISTGDLSLERLGLVIRFYAKNGQLRRANDLIATRALPALIGAKLDDVTTLLSAIADAQAGPSPKEGEERWRTDPVVAATWPELAFRLVRFNWAIQKSPDTYFADALGSIRVGSYRERPELTRALAGSYESNIERWAIGEVSNEDARRKWEAVPYLDRDFDQQDPARLPLEALLLGFGEDRDVALRTVACQSRERRYLLIEVLAEWGDGLDRDIVEMVAGVPGLSADEKGELAKAVARIYGREASQAHGSGILEWDWLTEFLRGKKVIPATRC